MNKGHTLYYNIIDMNEDRDAIQDFDEGSLERLKLRAKNFVNPWKIVDENGITVISHEFPDPSDYQVEAFAFAQYPHLIWLEYISTAILGECGEVNNVRKKEMRNNEPYPLKIRDEIGDIFWYIAAFCSECGWDFIDLFWYAPDNRYQPDTKRKIVRVMIQAAITLDATTEGHILVEDINEKPVKAILITILAQALNLIQWYEISPADVMNANLDKLNDRLSRGEIKTHKDEE